MASGFRARVRRLAARTTVAVLKLSAGALEVYLELLPGVRLSRPSKMLPTNLGAGILGAEAATWWAISPSLLPRPWWMTALNVSICQGVGHAAGIGTRFVITRGLDATGVTPKWKVTRRTHQVLHASMATITTVVTARSLLRQDRQAELVGTENEDGRINAIVGLLVGTLGYGALLVLGELNQHSIRRFSKTLSRWLPAPVSWPLAAALLSLGALVLSDRLLIRRGLNNIGRQAQEKNLLIFPGSSQPREQERSGSFASYETFQSLGSQGRAMVSGGPRKHDIAGVMGIPADEATEPIRVYVGLNKDVSFEEQAQKVLREMDRTGAFERPAIAMMAAAGTGWLTDWSISAFEFLTKGNCATVAMQYSYLPSAVTYLTDHDSPVESSRALIKAIQERLAQMDPDERPRLYVSGESLGAYGIIDSFDTYDDLIDGVDGAVFTGAPRFTALHKRITESRDPGSPERLPVIDGGRHVRFAASPSHIEHTFSGRAFRREWEHPRIVIAQHASDPVTFWGWDLFFTQPDWLREPGSRGVPAPPPQKLDVFDGMRWAPFITGWQVGLDQLSSLNFPGGHGHRYFEELFYYWHAALADIPGVEQIELTEELVADLTNWVHVNMIKR